MWHCKLKLDEEESNACLGKQNGFGPTFFAHFAEAAKRHR
jgi:hypothetical protein